MVVTALPISVAKVIAIARGKTSESRPTEAIQAELRAENQRHAAVVECLMHELAGMPSGRAGVLRRIPTDELRQSKKAAAATLDISEKRLDRLIARFHRDHPDQPQLGVQPDGNKYGRWIIYTERVKAVLYNEHPY